MKVLLVDVNCKYSSTGKIVYDLYTQLNQDGNTSAIAYGRGAVVKEKNIIRIAPRWEVYAHALLTRVTGYTGCFSPVATRRLIKFIEAFKPDVVHLHDIHGYFVNIIELLQYLKKNEIKTVCTLHCEFMYTGKCGHAYECEKWKQDCGACPHLRDYPQSVLFDQTRIMLKQKQEVYKGWDNLYIVSPSQWLLDRAKQSFLKKYKTFLIHNGVDTTVFYPRKTDELEKSCNITNEKVVLSVAPDLMSEKKGGRTVVEVAGRMREENIRFILIGVEDLEEKFAPNITAIGRITNQKELAGYYSLADVFLICSTRENFPTTCIEALCCGTPIVGYDAGGTAETAPDGLGKFIELGNVEGLVDGIKNILAMDAAELQKECSDYGRKRYSQKAMYEEYLKLYVE